MLRASFERTPSSVGAAIDLAVTLGVGILILVGFATSYRTLFDLDLAVAAGGYPRWLALAVPLSFDLVVLSLKVAQSARDGRRASVLRFLVGGLSALTVLENASTTSDTPGRISCTPSHPPCS